MDNSHFVEYITALTSFLKHRIYPSLSPTLLPSFHIPDKHKQETLQSNTCGESGLCRFCSLADSAPALFRDESIAVLNDIHPKTLRHILVLPREHYDNIYSLGRSEVPLIEHMYEVGGGILREEAPGAVEYRFGFHVPPRMSVNHLHLHCMALPFRRCWSRVSFSNKLWLMSPEDLIARVTRE